MAATVAFVLKGYPRLSETFIAQEIEALEARGLAIVIVSLRLPTDPQVHPVHRRIKAPVRYLPEYVWRQPVRVWRAWRSLRRGSGYARARHLWLRDLFRDPNPNRVRRFGQALVLAHEIAPGVDHIHAHFIHTPASVARYAAHIAARPWSCSAHAKDIWTTPEWEKKEKLADCRWLATCTAANRDHLSPLAPAGRVTLIYHGIDPVRFAPPAAAGSHRDGGDPDDPVIVLSVGRAVAKKGFDDLIAALAALPRERHWRFVHIGGGVLLERLKRQAAAAGLADRISWLGGQDQDTVLSHYRAADLFVLPCRITADGDRDGLPNVLMEAQSQALAVLSTEVSAIPELVVDGTSGILVPPRDRRRLAGSLDTLIRDPALRARLGRAGQKRVRRRFAMGRGIDELARKFGLAPAESFANGGPTSKKLTPP